jgi:hypothetical protein
MANYDLRFSYDKYFGSFKFDEFKLIAQGLETIVSGLRNPLRAAVLTCEDKPTYDWSRVSIPIEEKKEALKDRKEYALSDFTESVWARAFKSQFTIKQPDSKDSLMVCLTYDFAEKKRLFFYGQGLDEQTLKAIMGKFYRRNLFFSLGDGFDKPRKLALCTSLAQFMK